MFADDLKIFERIGSDEDKKNLQEDLDRIYQWCTRNKIPLNLKKCCIIKFSNKTVVNSGNYFINEHRLDEVTEVKDLRLRRVVRLEVYIQCAC